MEQTDGYPFHNYKRSTTTSHTLRKITPLFIERQRSVPRLRDLWMPKTHVSPNHYPKFYIPGVADLFQVGDCIVHVEHIGSKSRLISWRVWRDSESKWKFQ